MRSGFANTQERHRSLTAFCFFFAASVASGLPGLVVCYSNLWHDDYRRGQEEGIKDCPCVVLATVHGEGHTVVMVAPVTHSPARFASEAVEIPALTKQRLGLDGELYG